MSINLVSPVTGASVPGFTTPGYGVTVDFAPEGNGRSKQYAVTSLSGTQTGVRTHSATDPFTKTWTRPKSFRSALVPDPNTGVVRPNGRNVYEILTRKGTLPAVGQTPQVSYHRQSFEIVAGADVADAANVKALVSFSYGADAAQSGGLAQMLLDGII